MNPKTKLALCVPNIKLYVVFSFNNHFLTIKKIKKTVQQTPIISNTGKIVFITSIKNGTFKY